MKNAKKTLSVILAGGIMMQAGWQIPVFAKQDNTDNQAIYDSILSGEVFSEEDYLKVQDAFQYLSVKKADGITVDGDSSDWADYEELPLPTLDSQYQIYVDNALDATGVLKLAYDDEYFYFVLSEDDDIFYSTPGETYWAADSLQFTLSAMDESYGNEFGIAYNEDTASSEIYGVYSASEMQTIKHSATHQGTKTTYEVAVPWALKFKSGRPDKMKFSLIINDNDGTARMYCIELAPGIAEGKTNAKFPVIELQPEGKQWRAWSQADTSVTMGDPFTINTFIVNTGDSEQTFTITGTDLDESQQVTVPAHSGICRKIEKNFDDINDVGKKEETITVTGSDGNSWDTDLAYEVYESPATVEQAQEILAKEKAQTAEIKKLLDECAAQGITTEYETVAYNVLERFVGFIEDYDIPRNDLGRMFYTERAMDNIYSDAKEKLQKYLAKEKTPFTSPHYVTSDMKIDGLTTFATTNDNGKIEENRPFFYVGYGFFGESYEMFPFYNKDYGLSTSTVETSVANMYVNTPSIKGWSLQTAGSPVGSIGNDTSVYTEGTASIKISMQSEWKPNTFYLMNQTVAVEPGKSYTFSGKIKAENANNIYISPCGWGNQVNKSGTYDWSTFEITYVVPANTFATTLQIVCSNTTGGFWLDDLKFIDNDTGEDIIVNGGLEPNDEIIEVNPNYISYYCNLLEVAEKANLDVCIGLGPHYLAAASNIEKLYPDLKRGYHFYNINDPRVRSIYEDFIRTFIPIIKNYKSAQHIYLTNEPEFHISDYYEAYADSWHEYLQNEYDNDIDKLNSAYRTSYTSFDEIDINYSLSDIAKWYDVQCFTTQEFSRWHRWMYDLIKELAPDMIIHTKNMGYINDGYQTDLINKGMNQQAYTFLDVNGCDDDNYLTRLREPLVKEYWYEYLLGIKNAPIFNSEDHIAWDYDSYYGLDMAPYMSQDIWQGAIHGRAYSLIWLWEGRNQVQEVRDASINLRPDAMYDISKAAMDLNRNAYEVTAIQQEPREAGVIYTDVSLFCNPTTMHCMYEIFSNSVYNGVKTHLIPDGQLDKIYNYDILFVPEVPYAQKEVLGEIKKYIDQGGKVVIYGSDSLKQNEKDLPNDDELVNYIYAHSDVRKYDGNASECTTPGGEGFFQDLKAIYKEMDLPVVDIVDPETGEDVWKVESNIGVYDGKLIINLENFLEDKEVNVYVNGQKVTKAYELRDGEELGENIPLKQYVPILLQVEVDTPFLDTYKHWSKDEVASLAKTGIVSGESASRFAPDKTITRAEFLALLMRAAGFENVSYNGELADVESGTWYSDNVAAALANGIIDRDSFRPNDKITREEMCTMLVRAYEKLHGEMTSQNVSFTDKNQIGDLVSVSKATANNLFYGMDDGSFAPKANSTRAEAAAVISRFIK